MKTATTVGGHPNRWLHWQPKSPNILRAPKEEPSKPTEPSQVGISASQHEVPGDGEKGISRVIAGRNMKQLYFEDAHEVWFQDAEERFYHFDHATNTLTELRTRDTDAAEPVAEEVWSAFGTLLGILVLRKERTAKQHVVPLGHGV